MERRDLLSADPLHLGAVYYEDAFVSGTDSTPPGDLLHFTFNGGAEGTQLQSLTIELDPDALGIEPGARFFDTAAGGLGASGHLPLTIVSNQGIDQITFSLTSNQLDGTTTLTINFVGFNAAIAWCWGWMSTSTAATARRPRPWKASNSRGRRSLGTSRRPPISTSPARPRTLISTALRGPASTCRLTVTFRPAPNPANDYTAGAHLLGQQQSLPVEISGTV